MSKTTQQQESIFTKKAQGLPITTVALIIIVIIVLAAVAIFFFMYMGKGQGGVNIFQCQQYCSATQSAYATGTTICTAPSNNFCSEGCNNTMSCNMSAPNQVKKIWCNAGGTACSSIS